KARAELDRLGAAQRAFEARATADRAAAARARNRPVPAPGPDASRILGTGGPWTCPVQGPRAFSNDWGQPRSGGRRHQGNDILAPRGTPVVASVGGTIKANSSSLGGLAYYLRGDDGTTYFGAHLDRLGATGRVSAGAVIGYVGNSGNARGGPSHLHFEVHPGHGRATNPFSLLTRFC
ncbi:MAG: M23 family metallopeptidase, partial [Acidimicrobiales bacterium]